jgi:tetratricopeptide (TPR) repeat protein
MALDQRAREAKLREVEARLRRAPSTALRYERALLLDALGRTDAARKCYEEVLRADSKHFGAINNLALLLWKMNLREESFRMYMDAVERHPENPVAHANLAYMFVKGGDLARARELYETALRLDPKNDEAKRGLATVLTQTGATGAALDNLTGQGALALTVLPYRGNGTPIRVLLLVTLGAGNVAAERLLDDRQFHTTKLIVEMHGDAPLPPHDVVFNAVGDADAGLAALDRVAAIVARSQAPVINAPGDVARTTRALNAARLRELGGIRVPHTLGFARADLAAPDAPARLLAAGFTFPLLVRSPGFQTGQHFEYVATAADLHRTVAALPGDKLLVLEYVDARDANGTFRKYRAMFVGDRILPLHLALSARWKVHYFSADMAENAAHRETEAVYLNDMAAAIGPGAMASLERIRALLGLNYGGIDFGISPAGELIAFEANATMVIVAPPADERWSYRRAAVARVLEAVHAMIAERCSAANFL